ncbi:unnamed protein product [Macrosiphum euphorbiae]|uniref:THAP-type domain-containing protein n=1 Tax=Macrosiphum euphorbiae TaxID=13131 RepID=A0AAV0Y0N2_9HEMI|nr:unnamed protein product [Macrosiphum euphorbiae]
MHTCIVCFNASRKTKVSRPGVHYHAIPKNAYMRRKWLKVLGIDRCHDWQRVCSDHFLEENYKPGKKRYLFPNTIPQPCERNGFPSNYASQINDVETGNNKNLQMEQNIIREGHIGNAVNNFKSPRPSFRYTRSNEDMRNKNMPDHKSRPALRCSVKNCLNRHSKNLSFFGYPKDFTLRKMWMDKCGVEIDPSTIVKSTTRVCGTHFEIDCFKNTELKNRLKPGAVPTLFLVNAPDALPVATDELPVFIDNEAAEQSSKEKQNNEKGTV